MTDIKEYAWAFPIAGGIIALIAFLTPAGYLSSYYGSMNTWIWGLLSVQDSYGSYFGFTQDPGELVVSLISSLIVLGSIGMIISRGNKLKKGIGDKSWGGSSVTLMIGTIIWIVGMELNTQILYDFSLWSALSPGFGVIGMFLGGILALVGYGVSRRSPRQPRDVIVPMKKEFPMPEEAFDQPSETADFKFCPNCGYKIINASYRFCTNCGFELKGIPMT